MDEEGKSVSAEKENFINKISYFNISDDKLMDQIVELSEGTILKYLDKFNKALEADFKAENLNGEVLEECKKDAIANAAMLVKLRAQNLQNYLDASGAFKIPSFVLVKDETLLEYTDEKDQMCDQKLQAVAHKQQQCYLLKNKIDELKMLNETVDNILLKMDQ